MMKRVLSWMLCVACCGTAGCATSRPGAPADVGSTVSGRVVEDTPLVLGEGGYWYRVSYDPPVLFPIGVPPEQPTSYAYGVWVVGGVDGARYFIPHGGTPDRSSESLLAEALEMRTDDTKAREAAAETVFFLGELTTRILVSFATAMGGG